MALDDQVKSKSLLSAKGEEILRTRQKRVTYKSPQETELFRKMTQDMKELDSIMTEVDKGIYDRFEETRALSQRIQEMKKAAEGMKQQRVKQAQVSLEADIKKMASSTSLNQEVNQIRRSPESYGASVDLARTMGTVELTRNVQSAKADLDKTRKEMSEARTETPEQRAAFRKTLQQGDTNLSAVGIFQAAIDTQKKLGLDIESQHRRAIKSASAAEDDLEDRKIRSDVKAGAFGNRAQVEEQVASAAKKVVEAFERLDAAVRNSSEEATDLAKEFDVVNKEYKTMQKVSMEMSRSGGGGGQGGGFANTMSGMGRFLSTGGTLMQGAGELYRYAGVTSEAVQMQNRIGLASMANQRFDDLEATSRGDFSAWRRVMTDQFAKQVARGRLIGDREEVAQGLVAGGLAAKTAGGVIGDTVDTVARVGAGAAQGAGMGAMGGPWGAAIGGVLGGVGSFLGGAGNVASNNMATGMAAAQSTIDLSKSNSSIQQFLNAAEQQRQLMDVMNRVNDSGGQKTVDYLQGLTYATRGAGIGRLSNQQLKDYNKERDVAPLTGVAGLGLSETEAPIFRDEENLGTRTSTTPASLDNKGQIIESRMMTPGELGLKPETKTLSEWVKEQGFKADTMKYVKAKEGFNPNMFQDENQKGIGYGTMIATAPKGTDKVTPVGKYGHLVGKTITEGQASQMLDEDLFGESKFGVLNKNFGDVPLQRGQAMAMLDAAFNGGGVGASGMLRRTGTMDMIRQGRTQDAAFAITTGFRSGQAGTDISGRADDRGRLAAGESVDQILGSRRPASFGSQLSPQSFELGKTIQGGGDRENLFRSLSDPNAVRALATQGGLKMQDINRLTGMGVGLMGKEFARTGYQDLMNAGQMAATGYFQSPDQYMQARGQMSAVGGGAKDLEEILKNAVANGMDASKNIMQMVEATSAIASTSAGAGVNTFAGAAEGVGKSIDTLRNLGVSENMAAKAAQNAAQAVEGFSDIKGVDLPNVTQFAKLRRDFKDVSTPQLMALQNLSPSEIRQMQKLQQTGDTKGLQNLSAQLGIGDIQGITSKESLDKLAGIRRETDVMRMTGGPFMMNADMQKRINEKSRTGEALTLEERSVVNRGTRLVQGRGVSGDAEFGYSAAGSARKVSELPMRSGGTVGAAESMVAAGGAFDSSQFGKTMEKLGNNIEGFATSFAKVTASMPQEYMEAAQKSAESLSIPVSQFGTSVANLTTSINQLVSKIKEITGERVNIQQAPSSFRSMQNMLNGNVDKDLQVK